MLLGFIFGFNMRLGRLHFFLSTIGAAIVMTVISFAIAWGAYQDTPRGMPLSLDSMKWPLVFAVILFGWFSLTLQSMRVRDIGWDPVCVIPGWIAFTIVDKLLAAKFPALALGHQAHTTIIGAIVNLVLFLALMFWPSGDYHDSSPTFDSRPTPDRPAPSGGAASRVARVANGEFGRRTF